MPRARRAQVLRTAHEHAGEAAAAGALQRRFAAWQGAGGATHTLDVFITKVPAADYRTGS
jgi:hypothetical protein